MYIETYPLYATFTNPDLFPINCSFTVCRCFNDVLWLVFYTLKNVFGTHIIRITINCRTETTYYIQKHTYIYTPYMYIYYIYLCLYTY